MEAIVAAIITGGFALAGTVISVRKLRRENTSQHAEGRALITNLHADVRDVKGDVREVKADVRDIRGRVGDLEDRVYS
jgi:hypothetical protein